MHMQVRTYIGLLQSDMHVYVRTVTGVHPGVQVCILWLHLHMHMRAHVTPNSQESLSSQRQEKTSSLSKNGQLK